MIRLSQAYRVCKKEAICRAGTHGFRPGEHYLKSSSLFVVYVFIFCLQPHWQMSSLKVGSVSFQCCVTSA